MKSVYWYITSDTMHIQIEMIMPIMLLISADAARHV